MHMYIYMPELISQPTATASACSASSPSPYAPPRPVQTPPSPSATANTLRTRCTFLPWESEVSDRRQTSGRCALGTRYGCGACSTDSSRASAGYSSSCRERMHGDLYRGRLSLWWVRIETYG
eukprot:658084-Amorphochlora_amoeboformis.AAC.1